jgi:hypothetical protein
MFVSGTKREELFATRSGKDDVAFSIKQISFNSKNFPFHFIASRNNTYRAPELGAFSNVVGA